MSESAALRVTPRRRQGTQTCEVEAARDFINCIWQGACANSHGVGTAYVLLMRSTVLTESRETRTPPCPVPAEGHPPRCELHVRPRDAIRMAWLPGPSHDDVVFGIPRRGMLISRLSDYPRKVHASTSSNKQRSAHSTSSVQVKYHLQAPSRYV